MAKIRTFVAAPLSPTPPIQSLLPELQAAHPAVRAVSPDQLHLTLHFLGETDTRQLREIRQAIQTAAAGVAIMRGRLVGLGAFPNPDRPSVIWAGTQGLDASVLLAERLETLLSELGYPADRRGFTPHVTLARVRRSRHKGRIDTSRVSDLIRHSAQSDLGEATIDRIVWFRSDLTDRGPRHEALETVLLLDMDAASGES